MLAVVARLFLAHGSDATLIHSAAVHISMAAAASSRRAPRRPRDEPDDARPVRRSKRERKPAHSGMPEPCSAEEERLLRIAVEVSRRDQVRCVYSRVPPPFPALAARCPARGRRWAGNRTGPALRGTKASGAAAPGRSAEPTIGWNKKKKLAALHAGTTSARAVGAPPRIAGPAASISVGARRARTGTGAGRRSGRLAGRLGEHSGCSVPPTSALVRSSRPGRKRPVAGAAAAASPPASLPRVTAARAAWRRALGREPSLADRGQAT